MMTTSHIEETLILAEGLVLLRRVDSGLDVQLNRPDKRNALNLGMINALHDIVDRAEEEKPLTLTIRGLPGYFCAGADIAEYHSAASEAAHRQRFTENARDLCRRLTSIESIVVAVVDGIALGGGFELVLSADLVVSGSSSSFALPEVRLGLIPGWGGTQRLVRFVGPNRAKELIMTGTPMSAATAADAGIVTLLVPPGESVDEAAETYLRAISRQAPLALRHAKSAITAAYDPHAGDTIGGSRETLSLLELFLSLDGLEGVRAFSEKREPRFSGQ